MRVLSLLLLPSSEPLLALPLVVVDMVAIGRCSTAHLISLLRSITALSPPLQSSSSSTSAVVDVSSKRLQPVIGGRLSAVRWLAFCAGVIEAKMAACWSQSDSVVGCSFPFCLLWPPTNVCGAVFVVIAAAADCITEDAPSPTRWRAALSRALLRPTPPLNFKLAACS